ncbi:helix-turn-helix transcriptional regulator [Celerinatantimonas yamalensis]|uniref:WYL domain-containing protein n=1 Tax=Celerinatantimonas yamalensis TaxID=559956 RepID=A0ABW9G7L0_9GAMM
MDIQDARMILIEQIAFWNGLINVNQLAQQFGLSRQQASKTLSLYRQLAPDNLTFDHHQHCYKATSHFQCQQYTPDSQAYLQSLVGSHNAPYVQLIEQPQRSIAVNVLRPMTQALAQHLALDCHYNAISGEAQERLIAPHTLVYAAGRWHLRAWCFLRQQYRDFVLSRFTYASLDEQKPCPPATQDSHWHTFIELQFSPDSRLSTTHQQLLAHEYGMTDGVLTLRVRAPLANYQLKAMSIHPHIVAADPHAQQLVLVNKRDIEQWLY